MGEETDGLAVVIPVCRDRSVNIAMFTHGNILDPDIFQLLSQKFCQGKLFFRTRDCRRVLRGLCVECCVLQKMIHYF